MNYVEWNNIISEYFFNPANAGRNIHLYITRADIIHLAKKQFTKESEDDIWNDFIIAIKRGLPGYSGNITAKAKYAYEKRQLLAQVSEFCLSTFDLCFSAYILGSKIQAFSELQKHLFLNVLTWSKHLYIDMLAP